MGDITDLYPIALCSHTVAMMTSKNTTSQSCSNMHKKEQSQSCKIVVDKHFLAYSG